MNIEIRPLAEIYPYHRNPRKNDPHVDRLADILKEYGWQQPMVVDLQGVLIIGHRRRLAALKLGWTEGPVVVAGNLSPEQVKGLRIADNRVHEDVEWDKSLLALEIGELKSAGFNLALTAMNATELKGLDALACSTLAGLVAADEAPSVPTFAVSVPGDLWLLGNHRLLCGDSTMLDDVQRLMGNELADLVVTDPPYNVAYTGKTKDALKIENDSMSGESFYQFLFDVYTNLFAVTGDGCGIYVFHADSEGKNFRAAMVDAGWKLAQCCIWVKQTMVMGRQDYHWQHEPASVVRLEANRAASLVYRPQANDGVELRQADPEHRASDDEAHRPDQVSDRQQQRGRARGARSIRWQRQHAYCVRRDGAARAADGTRSEVCRRDREAVAELHREESCSRGRLALR